MLKKTISRISSYRRLCVTSQKFHDILKGLLDGLRVGRAKIGWEEDVPVGFHHIGCHHFFTVNSIHVGSKVGDLAVMEPLPVTTTIHLPWKV